MPPKPGTNFFTRWIYSTDWCKDQTLLDPRVPLAAHLRWRKSQRPYTEYTTPEPNNYNRAVITIKPMELTWVRDQVIYKNTDIGHWITLCYLPLKQDQNLFDRWAELADLTRWQHIKSPQVLPQQGLLNEGSSKRELGLNERLLTLGYYKKFIVKYFNGDATYVVSRIGKARADLMDLVQEDEI